MNSAEPPEGPLAKHAGKPPVVTPAEPWSDRTTASHWHEGQEWAVIVDWAVRTDGTRVPASVSLSSLGATLTESPLADAEPASVTRALVDSISWARVIANSRDRLDNMPGIGGDWSALRQYEPTPAQRAQDSRKGSPRTEHHDTLLQLTARIYRDKGGEGTPGIARRVHAELVRRGAQPMRRGPEPDESILTEETVRRWIKEARQRGHLDATTRRKSGPKTPDPNPGRGPISDRTKRKGNQ